MRAENVSEEDAPPVIDQMDLKEGKGCKMVLALTALLNDDGLS